MEIERINDYTVKFYLTYKDIERRGFSRDEVWYDRDRSEELFWGMMDELDDDAKFEIDGPLWIQVHALKEGIEVIVTRAQITAEDDSDSPFNLDDLEQMMEDDKDEIIAKTKEALTHMGSLLQVEEMNTFVFRDFENLIPLAKLMREYELLVDSKLFAYDDSYYICLSDIEDEELQANMNSILLEYGEPSTKTLHLLEEYGTEVMSEDVFSQLLTYFD